MELLGKIPDITSARLSEELQRSPRVIKRHLKVLQDEGRVVRIGGRKLGHWEVAGKPRDAK